MYIVLLIFTFIGLLCNFSNAFGHQYSKIYIDKHKLALTKTVIDLVKRKDWHSARKHAAQDHDIKRLLEIMECSLENGKTKMQKCPIYITYGMLKNSVVNVEAKEISNKANDPSKVANFSIAQLLWDNKIKQAAAYINAHKTTEIIKLRLKLKQDELSTKELNRVKVLINKDFGLRLDYIAWCLKKQKIELGIQILNNTAEKSVSHPQHFWQIKKLCIREIIYNQVRHLYPQAYLLATSYYDSGINFNDGEWLAGWIALEFLKKPDVAIKHFSNLYGRVSMPISISKAAYWLAKSYEKAKNNQASFRMHKISAIHHQTFYGQLSLAKMQKLSKHKDSYETESQYSKTIEGYYHPSKLSKDYFARMCYITALIHENNLAYSLLVYVTKNIKNQEELLSIYQMIKQTHNPYISIMYAKILENNGIIIPQILYPMHYSNIVQEYEVKPELLYAIMRQESRFAQRAKSNAGALGIMQLMPKTAAHITKKIGTVHKNDAYLVDNLRYNIMLGANSIKETLECYENSLILAIAAYNAGITNVNKWINTIGDVRDINTLDGRINWIESIPFYETRDYVVRVLENLHNYRNITNKKNDVESIVHDIMS